VQPDGGTTEWKSKALRAYQRRTVAADALIAGTCLAGTNTRRVRRALAALFGGAVGKDIVSCTWRKVKGDWDAWNTRLLAGEPIVRLILDGTVVRVRLDRKATAISLLVVMGVRADGQKVLLAVRSMGGESAEAWRAVLDDLIRRGLRRPEFLIVDGAASLDEVRIADGPHVLACHRRSWDKGAQVEEPAHLHALVEHKRAARRHRGTNRLARTAPQSRTLLERAAERGDNLGTITAALLPLLDRYGAAELDAAIREALDRGVPHPNAARLEHAKHGGERVVRGDAVLELQKPLEELDLLASEPSDGPICDRPGAHSQRELRRAFK
jgi:hypothetical protein